MSHLLAVQHLQVVYAQHILALKQVSLTVPQGAIVALLGANGAGKSTTLKAISQLLSSENGQIVAGDVQFNGQSIVQHNPSDVVKSGLVHVLEGRHVFANLTVLENLHTGGFVRQQSARALRTATEKILGYFPRLADKQHTQAGFLSGGEQQMLAIGRALMTEPKLILLDEPAMGLAPKISHAIFELIQTLRQHEQISFLLAEQNIHLAQAYTDYAYLIEQGEVRLHGKTQALYDSGEIHRAYLGVA